MISSLPNAETSTQASDTTPEAAESGILGAVLNQPADATPAELMRKAYNKKSPKEGVNVGIQTQALTITMKPYQLKSILKEHCYARPYNWRPETQFLRPAKTLFIKDNESTSTPEVSDDSVIDVCDMGEEKTAPYDVEAAKILMDECEKHVAGTRESVEFENWEEKVLKINWSKIQHNMFNGVVDILDSDRMSRLAYRGNAAEPALRRSVIEKTVKRFRRLMAQYLWDVNLIQWLHSVLMEYLNSWLLGAYLDMLQTLSHKLPTFVEKLMGDPNTHSSRLACLNAENVQKLMKRVWNPVGPQDLSNSPRLKPIIGDPIIILVPSATALLTKTHSKRMQRWIKLISTIARVSTVSISGSSHPNMTLAQCADQALIATRAKVKEALAEASGKCVFIVGLYSGSSVALQVAQVEPIAGVVCLGFSLHTTKGKRGNANDPIMEIYSPVFFVIGQAANRVLQENLEDVRERMNVETGLLVVGGADDYLRVNKRIKRSEGITQALVDKYVVEEVYDFVNGLLLSPFPPQVRVSQDVGSSPDIIAKRQKVERKRNNSNGSSLDSEPPSPTTRTMRPAQVRSMSSKVIRRLDTKQYPKFDSNLSTSPSSNSITPPNPPSTPESFEAGDYSMKSIDNPSSMGIYSHFKGMLPHVKQPGGLKVIPSNPNKQIKVLENVSVNPAKATQKMVRMPDGRYKAAPPSPVIRGSNTSQLSKLLTSGQLGQDLTKFIASKKQLQGNRARAMKSTMTPASYVHNPLPPPANLTSQDILNLPIIFADDNQQLLASNIQPSALQADSASSGTISQLKIAGSTSKLMLVNSLLGPQVVQKRSHPKKLPPGAASALSYAMPSTIRMDIDVEGELDVCTIPKKGVPRGHQHPGAGEPAYKTESMSTDKVTSKIKQAIVKIDGEHDVDMDIGDDVNFGLP